MVPGDQACARHRASGAGRALRLLVLYGDAKVSAIREALHAYAESIVADEWPKLSVHSSSQRTAELFDTLSQRILAIQPTPGRENVIYADLVKVADQLEQSREDRLNATGLGLPPIFWEVIAFVTVLLIGFAAFVEPRRARAMSLRRGLAAGVSLPYRGVINGGNRQCALLAARFSPLQPAPPSCRSGAPLPRRGR